MYVHMHGIYTYMCIYAHVQINTYNYIMCIHIYIYTCTEKGWVIFMYMCTKTYYLHRSSDIGTGSRTIVVQTTPHQLLHSSITNKENNHIVTG